MNKELEIITEINRLKHLCEVYQKTSDANTWKAIMYLVVYLCDIL